MAVTHEAIITPDDMAEHIARWAILFARPLQGHEISVLAAEYYEALVAEQVTPSELDAASRQLRRTCRYFPRIVEVLDAISELREAKAVEHHHRALPQPQYHTEEQAEINREGLEKLKAILGSMTASMPSVN